MAEDRNNLLEQRLTEVYRTGRISHAYILEGDPELTARAAEAFAKKLVSSSADILYPEHEKPGVFGVDDIRSGVQGTVYIRPYGDGRKVYILKDAELMNAQAQNALLKTIEEPPEYAVMLLCTKNAAMFLETVLSRCVVFSETDGLENFADEGAALSERTKECLRGLELRQDTIRAFLKEAVKSKLYLGLVPETVRYWFRDLLYLKCSGNEAGLLNRTDRNTLKELSSRVSFLSIDRVFSAANEAEARLDANVSPELTLEMLMNTVAEAYRSQSSAKR